MSSLQNQGPLVLPWVLGAVDEELRASMQTVSSKAVCMKH